MESEGLPRSEIVTRILGFFSKLLSEEKDKWNEVYKKQCIEWIGTVANDSEIAELEALRSKKNVKEYEAKLSEYKSRLSESEQDQINLWQDGCNKLNSLDIQQGTHHMMSRRDLSQNKENAYLLSNEQIALLDDMRASGASEEDIKRKLEQYYSAFPEHKRKEVDHQFKAKCIQWIQDVASFHEIQLFINSFERRNRLVFNILLDEYFDRLPKKQQNKEQYTKDICREMWREAMNSNRRKRYVDEKYNEWILWMTDEQKQELQQMRDNGSSFDEIHKKVNGHFLKLPETMQEELINDYKKKCRKYFVALASKDEIEKLQAVHDETNHLEHEKIINEILHRQPQNVRDKAYKFYQICDDVYHKQSNRSKRDIDHLMEKHLRWLTPEQKAEIRQMKASGESLSSIKQKLFSYIAVMGTDEQLHTVEKTKQSCYAWLENVTSVEERIELENLHHTDHSACKWKVREYIKRLSPQKQQEVNKDLEICEHIWYNQGNHGSGHEHHHHQHRGTRLLHPQIYTETNSRSKRDNHEHSLDDYFRTHLSWLTDAQKDEIRKMKEEGKQKMDMQKKILDYYENLTGDGKKEAGEKLRGGCRELLRQIVGDEKMAELKQMKESGLGQEELRAKVDEMLEHVTDEAKKQKIHEYGPACRKIYEDRHKRDNHEHSLDDYFRTHLSWLTDAQKDEIRKMKEEGKQKMDMQKKILDYYENLTGDGKKEAGEKLRGGCRELLRQIVGDEKMAELKQMKESGLGQEELRAKVDEMLEHVTDEAKKQKIHEYGPACRKIYEDRHKRDNHEHSLDDYFRTHLSWLTDAQKDEIRKMKEEGKQKMDMQKKILDYYENLTGDGKKEAGEKLRGGCRELLRQIVGDEKMAELKQMKESGLGQEELRAKVDEMLEHVTDEAKKQKIHEYGPACRIIFEMPGLLRNKREQVNDNIMQHSGVYLQWLTDEEKDEIGKATGRSRSGAEILKAIFSYYQNLHGKEKEIAGERLKLVCEEVIRSLVYENRLSELQALEDNDSAVSEMMKMLSATIDKSKFIQIRAYQTACNRIFDSGQIVRTKREQKNHSLDDYVEMNLKWLSMDQKEELREMKRNGKSRADMIAKVFHYYDELLGEAKEYVSELLKDGCRQILKEVIGEDRYNELAKLRNSGANMNDLKGKADAMLIEITDVEKKEKIKIYGSGCKRILATADHKHSLEDHFKTDLKWLTKEQKDEILRIKEENKSKVDIRGKILHFYKSLNEETKKERAEFLSGVCDEMIAHVFGEEKAAELKELRKSTSAVDEIKRRMDVLIERIEDDEMKAKAREYGSICRKIFVDNQYKQNEHSMTHYFRTHLKWLSGEQKEEIKQMKANGKSREEIQSKIFEFFESASGETKKYATESLMEGCYELFKMIGGEEKADELHVMIQSDLAAKKIEEKITSIIDSIDNESKKAYAKAYLTPCMHLHNIRMTRQKRGNVIATVK
nr:BMA-NPA-1, isoform b [Brugia malayi]